MTTQRLKVTGIAAAMMVTAVSLGYTIKTTVKDYQLEADAAKAAALEARAKEQEESDMKVGQYTINMIYQCGSGHKISDGMKQVLARDIVTVTNEIFEKVEHKRGWISSIAIESCFQRFAQSPTGPKGYGQLAKAAFHEGIANCSIGSVDDDDVFETKLNLYSSACYFRALLERPDVNGDPFTAMVFYNRGPNDEEAKKYAKTGRLDNVEALKYVAKATFLKRVVTDGKQPGIPSIKDINRASSKNINKVKPVVKDQ